VAIEFVASLLVLQDGFPEVAKEVHIFLLSIFIVTVYLG
jgi:hypothetical protein